MEVQAALRRREGLRPRGAAAGIGSSWALNAWAPVDTVRASYDTRQRLKSVRSRFLDLDYFHDAENPNNAPGQAPLLGAQVLRWTQNHAGGINGWRVKYKPGTAATTQGALPSAAEGWNGATHYGFKYDGMGRLTEADASVLSQPFLGSPNGWGAGGNFGTPMNATRPAFYGDERYPGACPER